MGNRQKDTVICRKDAVSYLEKSLISLLLLSNYLSEKGDSFGLDRLVSGVIYAIENIKNIDDK